MTAARGVALLLCAAALVFGVLVLRPHGESAPRSASSDDRDEGLMPGAAHDTSAPPADRGSRTSPDAREALGATDPAAAWRGQVARAIERIARERLGHGLAPADQTRLVDALATVGPAARVLDRESLDPDDPASIARVRAQTAALVAADRTCRDVLGIGVAELLRMLDPAGVEDRGRSPD